MGLDAITVAMSSHPGVALPIPDRDGLARLLEDWLPPFCTPMAARGLLGDASIALDTAEPERAWHGVSLWPGEEVDEGFPLSRFPATPLAGVGAALLAAWPEDAQDFELQLWGALRHRPPLPGASEGWYGRAVWIEPGIAEGRLVHLISIFLTRTPATVDLAIDFPIAGYPLTHHLPVLRAGARLPEATLPGAAQTNRELLLPAISRIQLLLHLPLGGVTWTINAGEALLNEDQEALAAAERALNSA